MVADKVLEIICFEQSKWLEKYNSFNTQKRTLATSDFEIDFYKLLNVAFLWEKQLETLKSEKNSVSNKKNESDKMVNWQWKLTFNWIHVTRKFCYF